MTFTTIDSALKATLPTQEEPLAVVLAGHNGSGKSTLWYSHVADQLRIPLINADRMMLSVLPEATNNRLSQWAQHLRDQDEQWLKVAQNGVSAFVAHAAGMKVGFAYETVFSHWKVKTDGAIESRIDLIKRLQDAGYFVLLMFVGLTNASLSIGRVQTRTAGGGHAVEEKKLIQRFPRTQIAIQAALEVADATILFDNSRSRQLAFTPVQIRNQGKILFDIRRILHQKSSAITAWLDIVAPITSR
jgi:predicted ABC-type ATPase